MYEVRGVSQCKGLEMFCELILSLSVINYRTCTHIGLGFNTKSTGVNRWIDEQMKLEYQMRD